jgi:predicted nucleic acid-binding protein
VVSVDAGIWLAFLRKESSASGLRGLLEQGRVAVHPFVFVEVSLQVTGARRSSILADLERLVACRVDAPEVVSAFVNERNLAGSKLDLAGAYLLVSAVRNRDRLWASDPHLRAAAVELGVAFAEPGAG